MITDFSKVNPLAVFRAYPSVVLFRSDTGAADADGNSVELDEAIIAAATTEQITEDRWNYLREQRDRLLAETDWVVSRAIDASNDGLGIQLPQVWMDYRQALRDLPANTVDPANPVWPTKP